LQVKELTPSTQVPPLTHGADAHSLMSVWHAAPLYPALQMHLYDPHVFTHAPLPQLYWLGKAHSLISGETAMNPAYPEFPTTADV
jgi:hypothetical protein